MMTKPSDMLPDNSVPLIFDEHEAKSRAATDLVKQIRKVRKQAEGRNFQMIAYLLNMAEIEASDLVANAPNETGPQV